LEIELTSQIRVGVMLDDTVVPNWVYSILAELTSGRALELALVILNDNDADRKKPLPGRLSSVRQKVFAAYVNADRKLFAGGAGLDAFSPRDASGLLDRVSVARVRPIQTGFVDRFPDADLKLIRSTELDVIVRFGFRILKGDILKTARNGIWSFHHGDNDFYRGGPVLFWEMYEDSPVSGAVLEILDEKAYGGQVIYKSFSGTHRYSFHRNRNETYWKSSYFVGRKLQDLLKAPPTNVATIPPAADARPKCHQTPSVPQLLRFSLRSAKRLAAAQFRYRLCDERWFVALARRTGSTEGVIPGHGKFETLPMPADRFYADPCVVTFEGRDFVFFEDYSFRTGRGRVSCATVEPSGRVISIEPVLEEPFHLSYPFVFEIDKNYYMIPESASARSIRLYRAIDFPVRWEFDRTLLDGLTAVDTTVHLRNKMLWMFTNIAQPGASVQDELHLFYASSLYGPWQAHPQNPIVSDVRRARSAGRLFTNGEALFRPSQNSSVSYGGSIVINAVEELTTTAYRETKVEEIGPKWLSQAVCTHTLSFNDNFIVTDGLQYVSKLRKGIL
jgi:hypothetical protein